jgi:iron complex transport system permease protein
MAPRKIRIGEGVARLDHPDPSDEGGSTSSVGSGPLLGRFLVLCLVLVVVTGVFAALSLMLGTPRLDLEGALAAATEPANDSLASIAVQQIRLPRLIVGILAGCSLALAGTILQDSLRNSLAGPELLGVSVGASLAIAGMVLLGPDVSTVQLTLTGVAGGLIGAMFVMVAARVIVDPVRLILIGAVVTALLASMLLVLLGLAAPYELAVLLQYLAGDLRGMAWEDVRLIATVSVIGIPLALLTGRALNLLQLGDEMAEALGLRVVRTRFFLMVISTFLVAGVVAAAGPIAWVALLAPHIVRRLLRTTDARYVLPGSALVGVVLLLGADLVARLAFAPFEIPVGICTTILAAPLLAVLLRREVVRSST